MSDRNVEREELKDVWACPYCGGSRWRVESVYMTMAGKRRRRICLLCNRGMIRTTEKPDGERVNSG